MIYFPTCRVCDNKKLDFSGHLGDLPQINKYSKTRQESLRFKKLPINLYFCPHCYHFQLGESFSPRETFSTYSYATQFTPSIQKHGNRIVDWFSKKFNMQKNAFVVEIASSDGAILRSFRDRGFTNILGVEPARNIAAIARENGIRTESDFFSRTYAASIIASHGHADFILARNVLAHVPETVDFLQGIRDLLAPNGVFCVETPYSKNMLDFFEFDTIYHEHLSYYLAATLKYLFGRAGLEIIDIEATTIHTGSIAVFAQRIDGSRKVRPTPALYIAEEKRRGYFKPQRYRAFVTECKTRLKRIRAYIEMLRKKDPYLAGYGSAAKANVLLNLARIDASLMPLIVDRSAIKQGLWSPGSGIPVQSPDTLSTARTKNIIIFAWNFADEILMENKHLIEQGKKFHVLIPRPARITPQSIRKAKGFRFYRSLAQ